MLNSNVPLKDFFLENVTWPHLQVKEIRYPAAEALAVLTSRNGLPENKEDLDL